MGAKELADELHRDRYLADERRRREQQAADQQRAVEKNLLAIGLVIVLIAACIYLLFEIARGGER